MKYVATINGKKYEVEVEKLEAYKSLDRNGVAAPVAPVLPASAPVQRPAAPAPVAAAPAPAPASAAAPAPKAAAPAGATTVEAPMPGKILNIKVSEGQAVKFGEVVVIMEAMKMETEIVAPADGTVSKILVKAGDSVDTGAALVALN
ncbi:MULTISPECIES: biotin/lipoyl-containing protein [Clostridium]|jgi:biotin carboxyl carrier protein|uniref:biotin/lipoyl-containing protein n=1 Tax=Clostridium TaxID=1485 RepID=UPI000E51C9E2|nr:MULTISPECIES: biotin/lipoyl-containing protein [Clostridium]MCC2170315.1 acetyl-CoA carboxylase biotin carboxyl carrier protein subunit [Clostridium fessum]RHP42309.1 acetyl-CoA carboxylase biotin carboxyl carrier protein subunit [Clostridium sp. AF32-7AC]RHQ68512.1 acetyl-CoA carboxylase biotin carboxyl carrier protein subunit [Clostridium sp. AF24-2LB]